MESAGARMELQLLKAARQDLDWLDSNYSEIAKRYENQFIALRNRSVVCSSPTMQGMLKSLQDAGMDPRTAIIKFVTSIPIIL